MTSTDELERRLAETEGLKNLKVKTYPEGDAGPRDRWIEAESLARVYNAADYVDEADAALIVAAVNALPELLALRETLREIVDWYDKEHPMRQADWHNPKCGCVRCKFDRARAALNQEPGQ